jgi:hypothetical protein
MPCTLRFFPPFFQWSQPKAFLLHFLFKKLVLPASASLEKSKPARMLVDHFATDLAPQKLKQKT